MSKFFGEDIFFTSNRLLAPFKDLCLGNGCNSSTWQLPAIVILTRVTVPCYLMSAIKGKHASRFRLTLPYRIILKILIASKNKKQQYHSVIISFITKHPAIESVENSGHT